MSKQVLPRGTMPAMFLPILLLALAHVISAPAQPAIGGSRPADMAFTVRLIDHDEW